MMTTPAQQLIKKLEHPEDLKPILSRFTDHLSACLERDGSSYIESGAINVGHLPDEFARAYIVFEFIEETNAVIEHLNLVIADLRQLPTRYLLWSGSPEARFYLLLRTYLNEFYRFREILSRILKRAEKRAYVAKDDAKAGRMAFHKAFEETIWLRNLLVHSSPTWKGKLHMNLHLMEVARATGHGIASIETGQPWKMSEILRAICDYYDDPLVSEGNRVSTVMQAVAEVLHCSINHCGRGFAGTTTADTAPQ